MKKNVILSLLAFVIIIFLIGNFLFFPNIQKSYNIFKLNNHTAEIKPDNCYKTTLKVVADIDYNPYTFVNGNGEYEGHDVELISEIANRLKMNLELKLLSWKEANNVFNNGQADIIMGKELIYSETSKIKGSLSIPIIEEPFVIFGKNQINDISQLYNKRLATISNSGAAFIMDTYNLNQFCTQYPSYKAAFLSIVDGVSDYVIVRYSVGMKTLQNLKIKGIKHTNLSLMDNYICFGISHKDPSLKQKVDKIIIDLISDKTLGNLKTKWTDKYFHNHSLLEYLSHNLWLIWLHLLFILITVVIPLILFIIELKKRKATLKELANTDNLTGLLNKNAAENKINPILSNTASSFMNAFFIIDIDKFKDISDTLGVIQRDAILKFLAIELTNIFSGSDIIGRFNEKQFFVLMTNITSDTIAFEKAKLIHKSFQNSYSHNEKACIISANIGLVIASKQTDTFSSLLKLANTALAHSKNYNQDTYTIYSDENT